MDHLSAESARLLDSLIHQAPSTSPIPGRAARPAGTKAAIRRCDAAWRRAFNACMEDDDNEYIAADQASEAFRNAMPLLDGYDGVRNFIACVAHGILIDAIPREKGGQLLYAAQVAMAIFQRDHKPAQAAPLTPQAKGQNLDPHPLPPH
jgi:hypothetical protein